MIVLSGIMRSPNVYIYMGTCDNTTDFLINWCIIFLAVGLSNINYVMATVYISSKVFIKITIKDDK